MRIIFLGNHTVGVIVLKELIKKAQVIAVVAHPKDPEDGIIYQSVYDFAKQQKIPVKRGTSNDKAIQQWIKQQQTDLLWLTDYRYLLPQSLIQHARLGAINLHPSLLPKYRGRAPINWAIIHGEQQLGLTAHYIDEGCDTGAIIEQKSYILGHEESIADALEYLYPLYADITRATLNKLHHPPVNIRKQNEQQATQYNARKPEDGLINWQQPATQIHNFIRALTRPYPGAFTYYQHNKLYIWKATLEPTKTQAHIKNGMILHITKQNHLIVRCSGSNLKILEYTYAPNTTKKPQIGDILHS